MRAGILLTILLVAAVATAEEQEQPTVFIPASLALPAGTESLTPAQVGEVAARLVNAAPSSAVIPSSAFATLVGPTAPARVHLVVAPASSQIAASLATLTRVPVSSGALFPGPALAARLGVRVASSSAAFLAAFPDAALITAAAVDLSACGITALVDATDGSFTIADAQFGVDDAAWLSEIAAVCAAAKATGDEQLVAIGAFGATAAAAKYGAQSAQATALAQATDTVLARYIETVLAASPRDQLVFYATATFVSEQPIIRDTNAVANLLPAAENTASAQIFIWVTVALILIAFATITATFGVGVDSEKDTLLYRATTSFH